MTRAADRQELSRGWRGGSVGGFSGPSVAVGTEKVSRALPSLGWRGEETESATEWGLRAKPSFRTTWQTCAITTF